MVRIADFGGDSAFCDDEVCIGGFAFGLFARCSFFGDRDDGGVGGRKGSELLLLLLWWWWWWSLSLGGVFGGCCCCCLYFFLSSSLRLAPVVGLSIAVYDASALTRGVFSRTGEGAGPCKVMFRGVITDDTTLLLLLLLL